jgi:hypothetical protein
MVVGQAFLNSVVVEVSGLSVKQTWCVDCSVVLLGACTGRPRLRCGSCLKCHLKTVKHEKYLLKIGTDPIRYELRKHHEFMRSELVKVPGLKKHLERLGVFG